MSPAKIKAKRVRAIDYSVLKTVGCLYGTYPKRLLPEAFKNNSKITIATFAKRHIVKKITQRPPPLFRQTRCEIEDLIKACLEKKDPEYESWKTAIEKEQGLQHLHFIVKAQKYAEARRSGNGFSCGEKCEIGAVCRNHQGEYQGTCTKYKGHDPAVAHSCQPCDDYTSSEEDKIGLKRSTAQSIGKTYIAD